MIRARSVVAALKRALAWTEERDRSDYAVLTSLVLFAGAVCGGWYVLPSPFETTVTADGLLDVVETEMPAATVLRAGAGLFAFVAGLVFLLDAGSLPRLRRVAWLLLALIVALPFVMQMWQPDFLRQTELIFGHVDRAATDMEWNVSNIERDWRDLQGFNAAPSLRWGTDLPGFLDWNLDLIGLSGQLHVLDMLGLSNGFFNIAGLGWYGAMAAVAVLLLAVYTRRPAGRRHLLRDLPFIPAAFAGVFGVLLVPRCIAEYHSQIAEDAIARGDDAVGLAQLRAMAAWMPSVVYALDYEARLGEVTQRRGCVSCPETFLYRASVAVKAHDYASAALALEQAGVFAPTLPGLRYWLSEAFLETGLDLFNAGQYSAADRLFVRSLALVPTDALAWYARSIVQFRLRRFDKAADYAAQVVRVQDHLGFRKYTPRAQWLLASSWSAYRRGDLDGAHRFFSKYLTPDLW